MATAGTKRVPKFHIPTSARIFLLAPLCVCLCYYAQVQTLPVNRVFNHVAGRADHRVSVPAMQMHASVATGLDVLEAENFAPLTGKRIGLITNQTGIDRHRRSTIDVIAHAPGVKLVALFSPEHGIRGDLDRPIASTKDATTGLPIYSLYGDNLRPSVASLAGLDAIVFDVQDVGVRFYTYITTMAYAMEAAAGQRIAFYVLDRPNPLGGDVMEGPLLDGDRTSFVGYFPMPVRMAMTLGEMAQMFNAENKIGCELHVIPMQHWRRRDWFDQTGLPWVSPSPNLRSSQAEVLYAGVEILQAGGVSVGRGTDRPFERAGAPWVRSDALTEYVNARAIPGVHFEPDRFTPASGPYTGQACEGVMIVVKDRQVLRSMQLGVELASALAKLYPRDFDVAKMIFLVGNAATVEAFRRGDAPSLIISSWEDDLTAFRKIRAKYLLYAD